MLQRTTSRLQPCSLSSLTSCNFVALPSALSLRNCSIARCSADRQPAACGNRADCNLEPCSLELGSLKPCSLQPAALRPCNQQPCSLQLCSLQPCSLAALQPAALQPHSVAALQPAALQYTTCRLQFCSRIGSICRRPGTSFLHHSGPRSRLHNLVRPITNDALRIVSNY
jgi:hypothetical protein